jgi:hypothetical protein
MCHINNTKPLPASAGRTRNPDLGMMRRVCYHCANALSKSINKLVANSTSYPQTFLSLPGWGLNPGLLSLILFVFSHLTAEL